MYIMQLPNHPKCIQDTYANSIRNDDRIHAGVITDSIAIRDNSAQYASLSYEEAFDIGA